MKQKPKNYASISGDNLYVCQHCESIRSFINDVELSMVNNTIRIGHQVKDLSPKEAELMYILLKSPGVPVPIEIIHRKIYGAWTQKAPGPETIYVYASHLRSKLEGSNLTIKNVIGGGYYIAIVNDSSK